ncbi:outer membrane lipid asymmetry maintenance protein MlaD [Curvivirga aplysinae]|uniref:outer membrane lipid asymmetry maintenance protein MlaD n=1 Tax=Curvivirga aplysinae TaxID=2529852 RepID=UPI0012BC8E33|nr:outer membrane lipid asymmetry maintenance protein MlaD [Curvivirga aplysinae]MTI09216.1 outer membrane lipid asymmetry maintenance protein MlaD [Curvivirga aplysinae]
MKRHVIETLLGGLVLFAAAAFLFVGFLNVETGSSSGHLVEARFNSVDGLTVGSDVRIGGVKVGTVTKQYVDTNSFEAVVKFTVDDEVELPNDSQVLISSNGLLGGKYLRIVPGHSEAVIGDEGELENTKDALSLEDLLGRAIFLVTEQAE